MNRYFISAQLSELREFAKKENLNVVKEFTESRTAKETGRPVFNDMLKLIEKDQAEGILSWNPDRLCRNSVDGGKIIYLIDQGKIKDLKFPTFRFDNNAYGKFILNIAFGQSKYYVDNLSENIRRGIKHKLRSGGWSGLAPLGYLNDRNTRSIVIDPKRAPIIRRLFENYATGNYSLLDLTKLANEWGLTNRKGNKIHTSLIDRILQRPVYYGAVVWNNTFYEGSHKPIIIKQLFDKVQDVFRSRGKAIKKGNKEFAYRSLIHCGECGCLITAERQKGHHYYHCTKKKKPCSQPSIGYVREENLSEQIKIKLLNIWINDKTAKVMLDKLNEEINSNDSISLPVILNRELSELDDKLDKLLDMCISNVIDEKEYQAKKEKLLQRKYEIKSKLANLAREATGWLEPMRDIILTCNSVGKIIKSENRFELRQICQKTGSNFKLSRRKLSFDFLSPFDLIEIHKDSVGELPFSPKAAAKNSELLITNYMKKTAVLPEWWRRWESNPRPEITDRSFYRLSSGLLPSWPSRNR